MMRNPRIVALAATVGLMAARASSSCGGSRAVPGSSPSASDGSASSGSGSSSSGNSTGATGASSSGSSELDAGAHDAMASSGPGSASESSSSGGTGSGASGSGGSSGPTFADTDADSVVDAGLDAGVGVDASVSSGDDGSGSAIAASCQTAAPGTTYCGAASESCCTSPQIEGGSFYRKYTNDGTGATGLADPATVSAFRLDKYDVTVGRFRAFVAAWKGGWTPAAGSGKHTHLNGGLGLAKALSPGTYETGWVASDNDYVAPTDAKLVCDPRYSTWTTAAGSQETLPMNCLTWCDAYAFCIWDGGFLPSEAEWEYAAAGGSQQREYPWGTTDPGTANQYAIYDCYYPNGPGQSCSGTGVLNIAPVGAATLGAGRWGQLDMAGSLFQWNLDSYGIEVTPCIDCAYLNPVLVRVLQESGSYLSGDASGLVPTLQGGGSFMSATALTGVRCARAP
jgi:sulfatase modifying factor 1